MKKEQFLQIAEDAWNAYEQAEQKENLDLVYKMCVFTSELGPPGQVGAINNTFAEFLGGIIFLAAMRPKLELIGGRFVARSERAAKENNLTN